MRRSTAIGLLAFALLVTGCGGGGGGGTSSAGTDTTPGCSGDCADTSSNLTVADVQTVIAQAVFEAEAIGVDATIAVVDRVGNVLGVYEMGPQNVVISTELDENGMAVVQTGLEGIDLAALGVTTLNRYAAIAKAITGAYLSSEGNAFTTRTANQIVQDHFNPGEDDQPAGPLFGVQFSQFACSDFTQNMITRLAPQRSPLGMSADPGGLPLYKGGTPVGGVGVIADGLYSIDKVISNIDRDTDELIATAATFGFGAPVDRRADRITVEGKSFRFSDVDVEDLNSDPSVAPAFTTLPATGLVETPGYFTPAVIRDGVVFGQPESGIRSDNDVNYPGRDAFVFVNTGNGLRFPPIPGTDGALIGAANALTAEEVRTLILEALDVANRGRAQIRRPISSSIRVTVSIVDTNGAILGMARTRDAPMFGADVSLQKARTAAFFSNADAGNFLRSLPDTRYLLSILQGQDETITIGDYVLDAKIFLEDANALDSGDIAFSDRAGGNLSRPFFPDGINDANNGPFSKPGGEWSVFSTGMQLDMANNAIIRHLLTVFGVVTGDVDDIQANCAGWGPLPANPIADGFDQTAPIVDGRVANGLQIFPGSVPIYRGDTLIGGIGVSGDGVDQDDMIAFLGLHNAGVALGGAINNAPPEIRADTLTPQGIRLRYIQCPQTPFLNSDEQNVCDGK